MTTTRRTAAAIIAAALSLTACSHTHRAAQVIEHSCTAPVQCERLAAKYPNDDVILTPTDTPRITEGDPHWNCLTMGNHRCGPNYKMVDDLPNTSNWIATIRDEHHGYDPYRCLVDIADTTTIVCQDGWVWQS
jgi:hypothetical protein